MGYTPEQMASSVIQKMMIAIYLGDPSNQFGDIVKTHDTKFDIIVGGYNYHVTVEMDDPR